ncbi:MAG: hypothetical protein ACR2RF_14400 [Geminicoccaceae bacterium]
MMDNLSKLKAVIGDIKGAHEDDLAVVGLEAAIDEACGVDLDDRKETYRERLRKLSEQRRMATN